MVAPGLPHVGVKGIQPRTLPSEGVSSRWSRTFPHWTGEIWGLRTIPLTQLFIYSLWILLAGAGAAWERKGWWEERGAGKRRQSVLVFGSIYRKYFKTIYIFLARLSKHGLWFTFNICWLSNVCLPLWYGRWGRENACPQRFNSVREANRQLWKWWRVSSRGMTLPGQVRNGSAFWMEVRDVRMHW